MPEIQLFFLIFLFGVFAGWILKAWLARKTHYSGSIVVTQTEQKILYSLVLNDYPETIQFKKHILLKVEAPKEKLDRE